MTAHVPLTLSVSVTRRADRRLFVIIVLCGCCMLRQHAAARALLAALLLLARECGGAADGTTEPAAEADAADDSDVDDDSDSAPFMIVVEHVAADYSTWRCSGSLVSLRTGVTSAECARGRRPDTHELWALAAATAAGLATRADGARRVKRVATAGARQQLEAGRSAEWTGALLDLAVLELEKPFGSAANARPILMATAPQECPGGGTCHVVRALPRVGPAPTAGGTAGPTKRARLRIVDATLAADAACASLVRYWAALRERSLCLTGPELCESELGAGVVCTGKLCGVVSRSAGIGAHGCGDTHAAQSVARWRRFLHCAHTLRACGRGACAELCSERRLLDDSGERETTADAAGTGGGGGGGGDSPASAPLSASSARVTLPTPPLDLAHLAPPAARPDTRLSVLPPTRVQPVPLQFPGVTRPTTTTKHAPYGSHPTRTRWPEPRNHSAAAAAAAAASNKQPFAVPMLAASATPGSVKPSPLFEPNRPDFKAGEYGDNAADYGAPIDEGGAAWALVGARSPSTNATTPPSPSPAATPPPPTAAPPPSTRRREPALQQFKKPAPRSAAPRDTTTLSTIIFLLVYQIL